MSSKQQPKKKGPSIPSKRKRAEREFNERRIRKKQMDLGNKITEEQARIEDIKNNPKLFSNYLQASQKLGDKAQTALSGTFSAQTLNKLTQLGRTMTGNALKTTLQSYTVENVIQRLLAPSSKFLKEDAEEEDDGSPSLDLHKLGLVVGKYCRSVPRIRQLNGPLHKEFIPKQKKTPVKRAKHVAPSGKATKADELTDTSKEEVSVADERIQRFQQQAKLALKSSKNRKKNFWKVVTNPNSFTETVENIFDAAFMVKQGELSVRIKDGDDTPVCKAGDLPLHHQRGLTQQTAIVSMTYEDYLNICKTYKIDKDVIGRSKKRDEADSDVDDGGD